MSTVTGVVSKRELGEGMWIGTAKTPIDTPFGVESTWSLGDDGWVRLGARIRENGETKCKE